MSSITQNIMSVRNMNAPKLHHFVCELKLPAAMHMSSVHVFDVLFGGGVRFALAWVLSKFTFAAARPSFAMSVCWCARLLL